MMQKRKQTSFSLRHRFVLLVSATLTGVLLLALLGLVVAFAFSVSRRYHKPDDALAQYPQSRQHETPWYAEEAKPAALTGFKVAQRNILVEMNAVQFVFTWRRDHTWECVGSLLLGEAQDIFGGWEVQRYSPGGCSSGTGVGGSAMTDFWQSPAWVFPRYFYFAYIGTTPDAGMIEFVLSDGTSVRAAPVDNSIGLVLRRAEPFYIENSRYLDENGQIIYESPGY